MLRCKIHNRITDQRYEFSAADQAGIDAKLASERCYGTPDERIVTVVDLAPEEAATARQAAVAAVQSRLDSMAQAWGYDSMLSLCTYATSKIPRFAAEGKIGANFRDDTWAVVDKRQHDVMSEAELMTVLPPIPDRPKA